MKSLRRVRILYATALQIEYVLCLVSGVLLGAGNWGLFTISLVLVLLLGFGTTALYWYLMDNTVNK